MDVDFSKIDIKEAAILVGALGYLLLPADIIPDMLGPIGFTDDAVALRYAFRSAINLFSPELLSKAKSKTGDILGDKVDNEALDKIIDLASDKIAAKISKKK